MLPRPRPALLLCFLLTLTACGNGATEAGSANPDTAAKPHVVTAFYPLQFIAERVAGDLAEVTALTAAGVEPHDLELTAGQIRTLTRADLLVYVGEGFQPAVEDLLDDVDGDKIDVLTAVELIEGDHGHADEEEGHEEEGEGHEEESEFDPHVWLDPSRMIEITRSVQNSLSSADPENEGEFSSNADLLVGELEQLDQEFRAGLAQCERREIVTSHSAFGYMADRYGLEQHGIAGLDPESEPSPQRLAEVTRLVKEEGVTTIFFERLLPPDLAETIAGETGTTTAVLDPLESRPESGDYLSTMRANLDSLRTALACS